MLLQLSKFFAKASNLKFPLKYKNPDELIKFEREKIADGVKQFKRRVLGICGRRTFNRLEELAQTLVDIGMVSSLEKGKDLVDSLDGFTANYSSLINGVELFIFVSSIAYFKTKTAFKAAVFV